MFADSLLDSPWSGQTRRGWITFVSFAVEAVAVAGLIALPLLYTQSLPQLKLMAALMVPAAPARPPAPAAGTRGAPNHTVAEVPATALHFVQHQDPIPHQGEPDAPPSLEAAGVHVVGGTGEPGNADAVLNSLGTGHPAAGPSPASLAPLRVSRMMEGNLIERIQPQYPSLARQARIQGTVLLRAVISRDGKIENLQVLSGHPMLVQAAMDAVRQWRYRSYYLNNEPVEVETQVTVNFTLAR